MRLKGAAILMYPISKSIRLMYNDESFPTHLIYENDGALRAVEVTDPAKNIGFNQSER
jgi:hypothetical protein